MTGVRPPIHLGRPRLLSGQPLALRLKFSNARQSRCAQLGSRHRVGRSQYGSVRTDHSLDLVGRDVRTRFAVNDQQVDQVLGVGQLAGGVQPVDRHQPVKPLRAEPSPSVFDRLRIPAKHVDEESAGSGQLGCKRCLLAADLNAQPAGDAGGRSGLAGCATGFRAHPGRLTGGTQGNRNQHRK